MKRDKETKTIRINPELWDSFKIFCIKKEISIKKKLEEIINKEVKK